MITRITGFETGTLPYLEGINQVPGGTGYLSVDSNGAVKSGRFAAEFLVPSGQVSSMKFGRPDYAEGSQGDMEINRIRGAIFCSILWISENYTAGATQRFITVELATGEWVTIRRLHDKRIAVYVGTQQKQASALAYEPNLWHDIGVQWDGGYENPYGRLTVTINGTLALDYSQGGWNQTNVRYFYVGPHYRDSAGLLKYRVDDVVTADGSADGLFTFPSPSKTIKIIPGYPNADGTYNAWSGDWHDVDDLATYLHDGDATRITGRYNQQESYRIGWASDFRATADGVHAVAMTHIHMWSPTVPVGNDSWHGIIDNGIYSLVTDGNVLPDQYKPRRFTKDTRPFNGLAWNADTAYAAGSMIQNHDNTDGSLLVCTAVIAEVAIVADAGEDTTPPANCDIDYTIILQPDHVAFQFSCPGDDGWGNGRCSHFLCKQSTVGAITDDSTWLAATWADHSNPSPVDPTHPVIMGVDSLIPGTEYWFCVRAVDDAGNVSGYGVNDHVTTPGVDTTPPEAITDLSSPDATTNAVHTRWTAPHEDGAVGGAASSYDFRFSKSLINAGNFDSAWEAGSFPPNDPGSTEDYWLGGLDPDTDYWFAIKSEDDAGNVSAISNVIMVHTDAESGGGGAIFSLPEEWVPACTWTDGDAVVYFICYKWVSTYAPAVDDLVYRCYYIINGAAYQLWTTEGHQNVSPYNRVYFIGAGGGGGMNGLGCMMVVANPANSGRYEAEAITPDYHQKFLLVKNLQSPNFWDGFIDESNIAFFSRTPWMQFTETYTDGRCWFVHYGSNTLWFAHEGLFGPASYSPTVSGDRLCCSQLTVTPGANNYSVYGVSANNFPRSQGTEPMQGRRALWCFGRHLSPRVEFAFVKDLSRKEIVDKLAELVDFTATWTAAGKLRFEARPNTVTPDWTFTDADGVSVGKSWARDEQFERVTCDPVFPSQQAPSVAYRPINVDEDGQPLDEESFNGEISVRVTTTSAKRVVLTCVTGNATKFGHQEVPTSETWWTVISPSATNQSKSSVQYPGDWWDTGHGVWVRLKMAESGGIGFSPGDRIEIDVKGLVGETRDDLRVVARNAAATKAQKVRTYEIDNPLMSSGRAQSAVARTLAQFGTAARQLDMTDLFRPLIAAIDTARVTNTRLNLAAMASYVREIAHDLWAGTSKITLRQWSSATPADPVALGEPLPPVLEPSEKQEMANRGMPPLQISTVDVGLEGGPSEEEGDVSEV